MIFCLFSSFRNMILILALGTNLNSQNREIDGELIKLFGLFQGTDISSEEEKLRIENSIKASKSLAITHDFKTYIPEPQCLNEPSKKSEML